MAEKRNFFDLQRHEVLGPYHVRLSTADAHAYLDATAPPHVASTPVRWLPPLQIGALLIEKFVEAIEIPPGLVHTGQSFEFLRAIAPDTDFTAQLRVVKISDRRGIRLGTIELELRDIDGPCVRGRSGVLAPLPDTASAGTKQS